MTNLNADELSEVSFLSGVNADGTVAATSFWTWDRNSPATYHSNEESKFGPATAGTGATIQYAFAPASNWTGTEMAAFKSGMALWSAVANVTFVDVSGTGDTSHAVVISRASDGTASGGSSHFYPGTIGTTQLGQSIDGRIDIDTSRAGFGPIGAALTTSGGYPWSTLVHELGHVIGLGHGGAYNDGDTKTSDQFTSYDSLKYTIMSYNDGGRAWVSPNSSQASYYYPTTPMLLDIVAAQRLYGAPTSTPLSGGQVFGYNSNISGDLAKFFDFTIDTRPVVTLWDAGSNNTLDLSGSTTNDHVNLTPGQQSDMLGAQANVAIAFGTRIDTFIGGAGQTQVTGNDDGDVIRTGASNDTVTGGTGDDVITVGLGFNTVDGGAGIDTLMFGDLRMRTSIKSVSAGRPAGLAALDTNEFDGISNVERIHFLDGTLSFDTQSHASQVYRLYDVVLARAPDAAGLDGWAHALDGGTALADVANGFTASAEFQQATGGLSNADFVEYLYQHALHRASDPTGKTGWVAALDSGTSRGAVTLGFSESAEETARTASAVGHGLYVDDPKYQDIAALYDSFANRLPDAAGLIGWGAALTSGKSTLGQIADGFAASTEFASRTAGLSNAALVDFMYHNTLDRAGDPDGVAGWTNALDHGLTRGQLLLDFAISPEHLVLIAPQITGGIMVG